MNTWGLAGEEYLCWAILSNICVGALAVCAVFCVYACACVGAPVSGGQKGSLWCSGQSRGHLRPWAVVAMETRVGGGAGWDGGEEGGAEEFDRAEGRAPGNEVHLVFVRARKEREAFWFSRHHLLEHSDLLTPLWRFSFEHVAVVRFGRSGKLWERRTAHAVWKYSKDDDMLL